MAKGEGFSTRERLEGLITVSTCNKHPTIFCLGVQPWLVALKFQL